MINLSGVSDVEVQKKFNERKSRGLGDTIHKITTALQIPQCGGCKQRQQVLNEMFPYDNRAAR